MSPRGARILIDARSWGTSTGTYVRNLVRELQKADRRSHYTVVVMPSSLPTVPAMASNFHVTAIDAPAYTLAEQGAFARFLKNGGFDLVHFAMQQQPLAYRGPKVTTFHDLTLLTEGASEAPTPVRMAYRLAARVAFLGILRTNDHIFAPTAFTRDALQRFARLSHKRITVTHEAGVEADADASEPYPIEGPFLLYVGNYYSYKNVWNLVLAHQELRRDIPDLKLVLAGKLHAPALRLRERAESAGYQGLEFTDFIPDSQRNWLYAHCAAYVFPSLKEGFGLPGLEAMTYGAPVVSSNASCLPEVFADAAEYFDPTDVTDMASQIGKVLRDHQLRESLRVRGTARTRDFSWERMARQTLEVYEQVLEAHS